MRCFKFAAFCCLTAVLGWEIGAIFHPLAPLMEMIVPSSSRATSGLTVPPVWQWPAATGEEFGGQK